MIVSYIWSVGVILKHYAVLISVHCIYRHLHHSVYSILVMYKRVMVSAVSDAAVYIVTFRIQI